MKALIKVRIREKAFVARLAARILKFDRIAIVLGHTIYLHNATLDTFINTKRWVIHELMHVEQYRREGWLKFAWLYVVDFFKVGYYNNRFEIEARNAEADESLLLRYDLSAYMKVAVA